MAVGSQQDTVAFGLWVKRARLAIGLTQDLLAERVGCATQTIRKIEGGTRRPSFQMAERLAQVLALPAEERAAFVQVARGLAEQLPTPTYTESPPPTAHSSHLPSYLTTFIGREKPQQEIARLLAAPESRLITLVGAGGIGKTRLAVEIARTTTLFADGVAFVPLAPIIEAQAVVSAIADALGLIFVGTSDLLTQLFHHLRPRQLLLVLDNIEHLLRGPTLPNLIAAMLREAPYVKVLATSREQLRLSGEWLVELDGLRVSLAEAANTASEAMLLFIERARHLQSEIALGPDNHATIGQICRLLGGIPLAIELAASWVTTLSCAEIAAEISRSLDFLSLADRDQPPQHQSMRAVFERSWALLSSEEQRALARLSVFRGGFTREAAAFVAGAQLPQVAALVQKSLLRRSRSRFELHEVIRRFAAEKLAELPEQEMTQRRFFDYYLALSVEASQQFAAHGKRAPYDALAPEVDNLRFMLQRAAQLGQVEQGARLCNALRVFWALQGAFREGTEYSRRFLDQRLPPDVRGDLYVTIGYLGRMIGDYPLAREAAEQAIAAHRSAPVQDPEGVAWAVSSLARALLDEGDYARSCALYAEAVALRRTANMPHTLAWGLIFLGLTAMLSGDAPAGLQHFAEGLTIAKQLGDPFTEGSVRNFRSLGLTLAGEEGAVADAWLALQLLHEQRYTPGIVMAFEVLAAQAGLRGRHSEAGQLVGVASTLRGTSDSRATAFYHGDYSRLFTMARGPLDAATFNAACAQGMALTREQALALARWVAEDVARGS